MEEESVRGGIWEWDLPENCSVGRRGVFGEKELWFNSTPFCKSKRQGLPQGKEFQIQSAMRSGETSNILSKRKGRTE